MRYRILALLFVLSFVNYLLRHSMSVALPTVREEFGFTTTELGWILGSFNVAYALAQVPAGAFGDAFGPRRALAIAAVTWGLLTAVTGFVPDLLAASAGGVLAGFMIIRCLLGIANAPMFPVAAKSIANWFPVGKWGFPNAALSSGLTLGQAAVGPVVTVLIIQYGWRASFYALAPVGLLAGAWWYWYGRDHPAEHRAVTRPEAELIAAGRADQQAVASGTGWISMLRNRDVLLLSASYFCMNYVFFIFTNWLFTYLVEERGFSLLESGLLNALPFIVGALFAAAGGEICDRLCVRLGPRWGCRIPGMVGLLMGAWLLLAGVNAPNAMVAVILLSLCFGFTQFTEGAYWQGTTYAAGAHTATACGVLNMGGNIAGFLAQVVGLMVDQLGWWSAFATGSVFAVIGAVLWLFVGAFPDSHRGQPAV